MKMLSVVGTAAMFMVGGSILSHGIDPVHHAIETATRAAASLPTGGAALAAVSPTLLDALVGVIAGGLVLLAVKAVQKLWQVVRPAKAA